MNSEEPYPGNPSEKFIEEKLKLNQIILNIRKIEEAIPIIHKMYKEQSKQSDTLLAYKLQMQDLISIGEFDTKLSAYRLESDGNTMKRLKTFQRQMLDMIQNKVTEEEFKKTVKEKVNLNDHYNLLKKVKVLETDTLTDLKQMLIAKIQEVDLLAHTKASQAELDVIRNNKIGQEELHQIESEMQNLKQQIQNLEGEEDREDDQESDGVTPAIGSEKYKKQTRNMYGYGDELYRIIKQDNKSGKSVGFK